MVQEYGYFVDLASVADRKILIAILEMATGRNKQRPYSKGELRDFWYVSTVPTCFVQTSITFKECG